MANMAFVLSMILHGITIGFAVLAYAVDDLDWIGGSLVASALALIASAVAVMTAPYED